VALDVELTVVEGRWFRHTPAGVDPALRPAPPDDNRWQRGRVIDVLYLCEDRECVWAEWYRHLAERAVPPQVGLPRELWTYEIASIEVADLRTADRLAHVGLSEPTPGRRSWPAFQAVGEQLHREGFAGIIAPSAARPQSFVLCVFLPDRTIPDTLVAHRPPRLISEPPAPPTGMRT
jgi:RES domain-containing protein